MLSLLVFLPRVEPRNLEEPTRCVYPDCIGKRFHLRQVVRKALRDPIYEEVEVCRYQCLECRRTFRIYPEGVTGSQTSQRVKSLIGLLYLLGVSYGAISLRLEILGVLLAKSQVCAIAKEVVGRMSDLRLDNMHDAHLSPEVILARKRELANVRYPYAWLRFADIASPLRGGVVLYVALDPTQGPIFAMSTVSVRHFQALEAWIEPIANSLEIRILSDANERSD
jgi:transposase-like protein